MATRCPSGCRSRTRPVSGRVAGDVTCEGPINPPRAANDAPSGVSVRAGKDGNSAASGMTPRRGLVGIAIQDVEANSVGQREIAAAHPH